MPRTPNRLTCSNAPRLGLHGKMTQQVSKKPQTHYKFLRNDGEFSFCPFSTFTGEEELASTTEEVTVGLKMINGRYRDVNVTLTAAAAATLEPVAFFSFLFLYPESPTVLHTGSPGKQTLTSSSGLIDVRSHSREFLSGS